MPKSKSILQLTLAAILLLALSACGGGPAPANSAPDAENPPAANNSPDSEPAPEQPDNQADSDGEEAEQAPEQPTDVPAPTDAPAEEEAAAVSYANDVFPIVDSRCATCHGVDRIEGELILLSYEEMMAGGESGPVIIPGDIDSSYLAEMISTKKMPKRGPKLTPVQTQTILDWINQGALNN